MSNKGQLGRDFLKAFKGSCFEMPIAGWSLAVVTWYISEPLPWYGCRRSNHLLWDGGSLRTCGPTWGYVAHMAGGRARRRASKQREGPGPLGFWDPWGSKKSWHLLGYGRYGPSSGRQAASKGALCKEYISSQNKNSEMKQCFTMLW